MEEDKQFTPKRIPETIQRKIRAERADKGHANLSSC